MTDQDWLQRLNAHRDRTLMNTLEIRYTDAGPRFLVAEMPVDDRHLQPMGILHGGASAALAESVGSAASAMVLSGSGRAAVGLELAINHLGAVRGGRVTARAEAVHLGRSTHLWQIRIDDDRDRQVALAKLTMLVLEDRSPPGADSSIVGKEKDEQCERSVAQAQRCEQRDEVRSGSDQEPCSTDGPSGSGVETVGFPIAERQDTDTSSRGKRFSSRPLLHCAIASIL